MRLLVTAAVLALAAPASAQPPGETPDPANGWRLAAKLTGPTKPITAVAVGPGWVAAGTEDGALTVWDAKTQLPRPLAFPPPKGEPIRELRAGPDGKSLYVIEGRNTIVRYTLDGDRPGERRTQLAGKVMSGGPDFKAWVVDTGKAVEVVTADLATEPVVVKRRGVYGHHQWLKELLTEEGERNPIGPPLAAAFIPLNGKGLLTAAPHYGVVFWRQPEQIHYVAPQRQWLVAVALTPDSRYMVAAHYYWPSFFHVRLPPGREPREAEPRKVEDRDRLAIVDHVTGKLLHTWFVPVESTRSLTVSPRGYLVASAGADGVIRLRSIAAGLAEQLVGWQIQAREDQKDYLDPPLAELRGHTGSLHCLVFDPAGKRLVSAGDDKTVRVWERP